MAKPLIDTLCDNVSLPAMMRHLRVFARRVKLSGTREELASFRYLERQLKSYGLKTNLISHDAYISLPGRARLRAGGRDIQCITHSFSRSSPKTGLSGKIVYAGAGSPADFAKIDAKGRIVLLEHIANPAATLRASQAGAIGQIHISPHEHLHEMCISPVWGSPTPDALHLLPKTVVVSVRKADGERLKAQVKRGASITATLHASIDTRWRKTPLLVADLWPRKAGADTPFIMFSGHHDTWHFGVMDNGSANATQLEVARLLAPHRAKLKRGLRLCFWSGHSHGRYSGSTWYADNHWAELARNCAVHVNVDSTGAKGNTILSDAQASTELYDLAAEAIAKRGGQKLDRHRMSRAGDQSFWGIGIPSIFMAMGEQPLGASNVMSAILGGANRKSAGLGWWWHTPEDTLDKIDGDLLLRDTRIYVHTLWRLLTDRILPLNHAASVDALRKELAKLNKALDGRLDITPLVRSARALHALTKSLSLAGADSKNAARINAALMAVSRAITPIDYTRGDRFTHDPALGQSAYPVLDPLRALAVTKKGSDAAQFATVAAMRAVNRVSQALAEAREALARM